MPDTAPLTLIYSPFPSLETASAAAQALLTAKLVGCCNILPGMQSLYWWQGAIETAAEMVLIAKTSPEQAAAAAAMLRSLHPYQCPAILQWQVAANGDYHQWLSASLA